MPKVDKSLQFEVIVRDARLSYPALFKPEASSDKDAGPPRYKASLLLDPKVDAERAQISDIKSKIDGLWEKMMEKPGTKAVRDKTALKKDGVWDGYEGMWYISAARSASQGKPVLLGKRKEELKDDSTELYAGCRVNGKIRFYAHWHEKSGYRVNASIEIIQKAREDKPFGAGPASIDDMPDVDDAPDADDLSDDIDDEGL